MAKKNNNEKSKNLIFQISEAYKKARTNLSYSIIKKGCKKIVFTSPLKSEGKSTTSVNIAIALSQQIDKKVIIVDCDLRRPTVHTVLNTTSDRGLANFLNNECSLSDVIQKTENESLDFISFGVIPPNPSELLSSVEMENLVTELEKIYDYIIFDTPPVNPVVDTIPLIRLSDGVVMVVRHNQTTVPELNKAITTIKRNSGKILGIIITQIPSVETSKGSYYFSKSKRNSSIYNTDY
ncbi:MAG: CpsD/CapB family tyrosine-protein kinase [Oscillospiraceae bacterium]|nr:CpsD/CapB family tyrosine-protein kinase [Oscillospiraceae bacterium]